MIREEPIIARPLAQRALPAAILTPEPSARSDRAPAARVGAAPARALGADLDRADRARAPLPLRPLGDLVTECRRARRASPAAMRRSASSLPGE